MPISVPPYMPMRQEVRPNIDIGGSIAGLGDALQQGMEFGQKRRVDRATRAALAQGLTMGPDGLPDYMSAAGNILAGGGDTDTALTLARLADAQNQRLWQQNQPDWQVVNGSLYNLKGMGGQRAAQPGPASPQAGPGPAPSGDQPDYPPPEEPQQQADAGEPQPIIRGPKKPPQRRTDIDAEGNVVTTEAGDDGVWRVVSGHKKAVPKPPTEDQLKNRQLLSVVSPELTILDTTFADLAKPENQVGAGLAPERLQNYAVSPGYQRARAALRTIIASYLYSVSGATANPGEVETQTDVLMPKLGEDATTTADKRARVKQMAEAIRIRAGQTTGVENAAPAGDEPEPQDSPQEDAAEPQQQEQGQVVQMNDGRRFRLMPDGTVIQLD